MSAALSIPQQMAAFMERRRGQKFTNRFQIVPVAGVDVQFIGEFEEPPCALTPEGRPIHDPGIGDQAIAGDPTRRLQYVKDGRHLRHLLAWIHARRSKPRPAKAQTQTEARR